MSKDIERIVPDTLEWEAYYANHIFRYNFAADIIENPKNILDAACGVGYGSKYLAIQNQAEVIGVDANEKALKMAEKYFHHELVKFIKDNCETLESIKDNFSHIISFETFEHLSNPVEFLRRAYEILIKNGKIIISTPNASVTSPDRKVNWQYHEHEYTASELIKLVKEVGFKNIKLFGQTYSELGKLRNDLRKELNRINHNPFVRMGKWMQRVFRGVNHNKAILPENIEDFKLIEFTSPQSCEEQGATGPFVLLVIAEK